MNTQKRILVPILCVLLLVGLAFIGSLSLGTRSALAQQSYQTPTPNAQGQIIYVVQPGDNCTTIFLRTNVAIETIRSLNNLDEACSVYENQELLLAQVEAPTVEPTAAPVEETPPPVEVTPVPVQPAGFAEICVVLFHDLDGNATRTEGETYLYGGVVSVNDRLGQVSLTGNTVAGNPDEDDTVVPLCFQEVPPGNYNVSIAIPDGFNPTTTTNLPLEVKAGDIATIDFGAQEATARPSEVDPGQTNSRSPLLGIIGAVILLSGLGLGFYMWRQRRI